MSVWFGDSFVKMGLVVCARQAATTSNASAQSVYFEDDFECLDETDVGVSPSRTSWERVNPADPWRADANDGVSPKTDDLSGSFGNPVDFYENFLVTGHNTWNNVGFYFGYELFGATADVKNSSVRDLSDFSHGPTLGVALRF